MKNSKEVSNVNLNGKKVYILSGIADHKNFIETVMNFNCEIAGSKSFPDHYHYNYSVIKKVVEEAKFSIDSLDEDSCLSIITVSFSNFLTSNSSNGKFLKFTLSFW